MDMLNMPIDQLGSQAYGHYKVAVKAHTKAEEHYKSAGLYLKAAKQRVLKTKGLTFERWLKDHCPISRRRADEVIAIAHGNMDPDYHTQAARKQRQEAKSGGQPPDRSGKPNENNDRPHQQKTQHSQPEPDEPLVEDDPVKEAEEIGRKEDEKRRKQLIAFIKRATLEQLQAMEDIVNV